ncbi:unnamed protein product [Cuscuta europaea]|uniref:VPS37 C-terminal domain-containing protein n=1 Tax=Cuscuta europaea TaxID=41803 RepID=A0A9P1EAK6_CUSEU|nr:unnamed protein product [Cuscuta europaea]
MSFVMKHSSWLVSGGNLEKEPRITELRNQCRIIRTTELAAAQETLHDLERRKEELLKYYSPASLLHRLEEATNKTDDELKPYINSFLIEKLILLHLCRSTRNCGTHTTNMY